MTTGSRRANLLGSLVQLGFEYLQDWRSYSLSGHPIWHLTIPRVDTFTPYLTRTSHAAICSCCLLPCRWASPRTAWLCLLHTVLLRVIDNNKMSPLPPQNPSFSQPRSSTPMSFCMGSPKLATLPPVLEYAQEQLWDSHLQPSSSSSCAALIHHPPAGVSSSWNKAEVGELSRLVPL